MVYPRRDGLADASPAAKYVGDWDCVFGHVAGGADGVCHCDGESEGRLVGIVVCFLFLGLVGSGGGGGVAALVGWWVLWGLVCYCVVVGHMDEPSWYAGMSWGSLGNSLAKMGSGKRSWVGRSRFAVMDGL